MNNQIIKERVNLVKVNQYDVVWVDLPEVEGCEHIQKGRRPAVIISGDRGNCKSPNVHIVPITSQTEKAKWMPTHLMLNEQAAQLIGLKKASVITAESFMPVSKSAIVSKVGRVESEEMRQAIKRIINAHLGGIFY